MTAIPLELSRPMLRQHIMALAAIACLFLASVYDRRAPLKFIDAEIMPSPVISGHNAVLRWTTNWSRSCEGEVSREIIGSDGVIKPYRKRVLRVPIQLGQQTSDTDFIAAGGLPPGAAIYRATVRFHNCGVTSWFFPLEVKTPEIVINVIKP